MLIRVAIALLAAILFAGPSLADRPNIVLIMADESQWCLYNLENDRTEMHDLSASMPDRVDGMKQRWNQ